MKEDQLTEKLQNQRMQTLEKRLRSHSWIIRKQAYEQLNYLFEELESSNQPINIGGQSYTVSKLLKMFQDLTDEEHPSVLLIGLDCILQLLGKQFCSGRDFVKLIDQGFDKFPLKISRGKEIMQKFADIVEHVGLDMHFMSHKLNNLQHEKCLMYALEIVGLLGMTQLKKQVYEMSKKNAKKTVREVAVEIYEELSAETRSDLQGSEQNISSENIEIEEVNKKPNKGFKKPIKAEVKQSISNKQSITISAQPVEKLPHYEKMTNKQQQAYSQNLLIFFEKYFKYQTQDPSLLPNLPPNQISILSHIIRVMAESNNHILSTNGLKILKILIENNSTMLPKSYPLLFIFQKFKLRASHQINHLLFELCDSIVISGTARTVDLLQAVFEGGNVKKANVKYGAVMVFLRVVAIVTRNQDFFAQIFQTDLQKFAELLQVIPESQCENMKKKLNKNLMKCLQSLPAKKNEDKKYDQKLSEAKSMIYQKYQQKQPFTGTIGTKKSTNNKIDLQAHERSLKKTLSQVGPRIQTFNHRNQQKNTKLQSNIDLTKTKSSQKLSATPSSTSVKTTKTTANSYKIINPQQKISKILQLCNLQNEVNGKNSINLIKKTIRQSLQQIDQCIKEGRFQLFYYSELLDNFIREYEPDDDNCEIISDYLLQLLKRFAQVKPNADLSKIKSNSQARQIFISQQRDGLMIILRICLCELVLGKNQLAQVLTMLSQTQGIKTVISSILGLASKCRIAKKSQEGKFKVKKKNRKIMLRWLDQQTPADCLSEEFFKLVESIEQTGFLAVRQKQQNEDEEVESVPIMKKHMTFAAQQQQNYEQLGHNKVKKPQIKQTSLKQKMFEEKQSIKYHIQPSQTKRNPFLKQMEQQIVLSPKKNNEDHEEIVKGGFDGSQISHIQFADDPSASKWEGQSYLQGVQTNRTNQNVDDKWNYFVKKLDNDKKVGMASPNIDYSLQQQQKNDDYYLEQQKKIAGFKKTYPNQQTKKQQKYSPQFNHRSEENSVNVSNENEDNEDEYLDVDSYKNYIKKIRQTYLPKQYIEKTEKLGQKDIKQIQKQEQQRQKFSPAKPIKNEEKKQQMQYKDSSEDEQQQKFRNDGKHEYEPIFNKNLYVSQQQGNNNMGKQKVNHQQAAEQHNEDRKGQENEDEKEQENEEFSYKIINKNKLEYMLKNTANPYSHLRNQIIIPFRKSSQQEYFLQQFHHFVSSIQHINLPQPYNSLLLTVILLFQSIHANRSLIGPLQELYQYMASLETTNIFLKTIISLFHSVIEETAPNLRSFLITILTKSVARLMPYCQDPIELLRDFSQFYNVGQNVYFQMYEKQYKQICGVVEGDALYQVVQRALLQEGQNLKVIVQNWFQTVYKAKVKQFIEDIINSNEEDES